MAASVPELDVEEIAAKLRSIRRSKTERSVLFLGTRVGRLFGNTLLYDNVKPFSLRNFDLLPDDYTKFNECFETLRNLNEKDIYDILIKSLKQNTDLHKDNTLLAELIEEGFFDIIISTDMDDGLERALIARGMKPKMRFHIYAPPFGVTEDGGVENILQKNIKTPALIKVFGDLKSRRYKTAYDKKFFESELNLKRSLENLLDAHILAIGYDPFWDEPLENVFPLVGGSFWYVNENFPPVNSQLFHAWHTRNEEWDSGRLVSQKNWRFFVRELHRVLVRDNNLPANTSSHIFSGVSTNGLSKKRRKHIFISYSHGDTKYFNELVEYLSSYKHEGLINFWSDKEIKAGSDWHKEILEALQETSVAVVLVSQRFLNSKFIQDVELPQLLEATQKHGVIILPVLISHCLFKQSKLGNLQLVNPSRPLAGKKEHTRDAIWVDVVKNVEEEYRRNAGF